MTSDVLGAVAFSVAAWVAFWLYLRATHQRFEQGAAAVAAVEDRA